ncbi:MAG: HPr(Ser) kinase/phosphatase [Clostridia bacterium]|nr:HPr(Ser) kinase/phosphatase [Clostridia bacterium]
MQKVSIDKLMKEFKLQNYTPELNLKKKMLSKVEVNIPSLELTGFFELFDSDRIQLIGRSETIYLNKLSEEKRKKALEKLFSFSFPCVIFTHDSEPIKEVLTLALEKEIPVLKASESTTNFMGELIRWLRLELAPIMTLHAELVDVYGEGVLIMGESSVGKSETALELVKRNHRLVADDVVEIKRAFAGILIGTCPEVIRHFIELRGVGIVNVKELFGIQSVLEKHTVDLVIKLEPQDNEKSYDRLGLYEEHVEILGVKVPTICIPVSSGRNLAVIIETAALNHRQKKIGYNAAEVLTERVIKKLED